MTQALYRFFGKDGDLLYIGISADPGRRFKKHHAEKEWWSEVARIELHPYMTRAEVEEAERAAIRSERPRYNIQFNAAENVGRKWAVAVEAGARVACGLEVGRAYAIGLSDGECPVGVVADGDDNGVALTLVDWWSGLFSGSDEWITADSVVRWRRAEALDKWQKRSRGYADEQLVYDLDPLSEFQKYWTEKRAHPMGRIDTETKEAA